MTTRTMRTTRTTGTLPETKWQLAMTLQSDNNWQRHGGVTLTGNNMAKQWQLASTRQAKQQKKKYENNNKRTNSQICNWHEQNCIEQKQQSTSSNNFGKCYGVLGLLLLLVHDNLLGVSLWSCWTNGRCSSETWWLIVNFVVQGRPLSCSFEYWNFLIWRRTL